MAHVTFKGGVFPHKRKRFTREKALEEYLPKGDLIYPLRQHIGGTAELPAFTLGENWVEKDGYYYYTLPVAPGKTPAANLADKMTLTASYDDADGGKQALDVMAEAIQSTPEEAVADAWGVKIAQGSVTKAGN